MTRLTDGIRDITSDRDAWQFAYNLMKDRAHKAEADRAALVSRLEAARKLADEMTLADEGGEFEFYIARLRAALEGAEDAS